MRCCLLIPHYNHHEQLARFLPSLVAQNLPCVIVDDGSRPESLASVQQLVAQHPQVTLLPLPRNRGKGRAIKTGLSWAGYSGYTHVLQIDADGQHHVEDIPRFIAVAQQYPDAIISGEPTFDASAPAVRRHGRKITRWVCMLETFSGEIRDGLCGFRLYPVSACEKVLDAYYLGNRMDFDPEFLVKAIWQGIPVRFVTTPVIYPTGNISHFNYVRDNLVLIKLHCRLLLSTPWNITRRFFRRVVN